MNSERAYWTKEERELLSIFFLFFFFLLFPQDVDECTASSPVCDANAFCNNSIGSYNCTRKPGYFGDGKTCKGEKKATDCTS